MGNDNRTSWFDLMRRAFRSPSGDQEITRTRIRGEQKQEQKKRRNWKWLYRRNYYLETTIQHNAARIGTKEGNLFTKQPQVESFVSQERRAIAVAMATTAEAAAAVKTAQAAVEVIRLSRPSSILVYHATVVIQSIFRGYLARRALLALKGVVKLQALIRGYNVRKRAKMTLQCIQSLVRVQALVCDQRRRLSYEATSPCSMLGQAKRDRKTFMSVRDKYQLSDTNHEEVDEEERSPNMSKIHPFVRKERNSYSPYSDSDQSLDSYLIPSPLHKACIHFPVDSPKTPSSSKIKPIQVPFCSPRCPKEAVNYQLAETPTSSCSFYSPRTSMSESCCSLSRPNYMANTASTTARVKSIGTPRLCRPSSPSREQMMSSTKKRLLFPVTSDQNSEENLKVHTYE